MRSRYTAYVRANIPYLKSSLTKKSRKDFDAKGSKAWAEGVEWQGLKVVSTKQGTPSDDEGVVEFIVTYRQEGSMIEHHEVAHFKRDEKEHWKYDDGDIRTLKDGEPVEDEAETTRVETFVRDTPKVGRNDPCSCGSGKKFKKCCG